MAFSNLQYVCWSSLSMPFFPKQNPIHPKKKNTVHELVNRLHKQGICTTFPQMKRCIIPIALPMFVTSKALRLIYEWIGKPFCPIGLYIKLVMHAEFRKFCVQDTINELIYGETWVLFFIYVTLLHGVIGTQKLK